MNNHFNSGNIPVRIVKNVYFFLTLFLTSSTLSAATIDFNSTYGNSGNIAQKIQTAVSNASNGDIIKFNSAAYNLNGASIIIEKPITIQGKNPNGFNAQKQGASGIQTVWKNTGKIQVLSNNVKFKNIRLERKEIPSNAYTNLISARVDDEWNPGTNNPTQYKGIVLTNVELKNAGYAFQAGNGAGVTMTNVSFTAYKRIGFIADRRARVSSMPKVTFEKCSFLPSEPIGFDNRAISFDAGNSGNPIVWNLSGTVVYNCYIKNTGIALSRCHNMTIDKTKFEDYKGKVDLIHIEEFSHNVAVHRNTFDCHNDASKIILIDRELQVSNNISIKQNIVKGNYNFFISSYAPFNIDIIGNDFRGTTKAANDYPIGFGYYEGAYHAGEELPANYDFVSEGIVIKNNLGLNRKVNGKYVMKKIRLIQKASGHRNVIQNYDAAQKHFITKPGPYSFVNENKYYEIRNKAGGKLASGPNNTLVIKNTSDNTVKWDITWKPPYTYIIKNKSTGKYLETIYVYTEENIFASNPSAGETLAPYMISYANNTPKNNLPFWCLHKQGSDWKIMPGGNEKQSALAKNGSNIKLLLAKELDAQGHRKVKTLGNNALWSLVASGQKAASEMTDISEETSAISAKVYPNPANDVLNVYLESEGYQEIDFKLYDMQGSVVLQKSLQSKTSHAIDVSNLSKGIYHLWTDVGHKQLISIE